MERTNKLITYWVGDGHAGPDGQQLEIIKCSACETGVDEQHTYPMINSKYSDALDDLRRLIEDDLLEAALKSTWWTISEWQMEHCRDSIKPV